MTGMQKEYTFKDTKRNKSKSLFNIQFVRYFLLRVGNIAESFFKNHQGKKYNCFPHSRYLKFFKEHDSNFLKTANDFTSAPVFLKPHVAARERFDKIFG
jgi:hypothetical protein